MADENLRGETEELESPVVEETEEAAGLVDEAAESTEQAAESTEQAAEADEQATEATEQATEAEALDEMVEIAVENVAKEAAAESAVEEEAVAEVPAEQATDTAPTKKRERRSKQARAEKAARSGASEPALPASAAKTASYGLPVLIAAAVGCLALGLVLGRFVLGGGAGSGAASGKTVITEAELDNAYANYTYQGKSSTVTFREVIEMNGSLEASADADGNYKIPAAENALNAARTAILNKEIESRGIEVTEEEVTAYAEQSLGTSDFDAIASTYGMEPDAVKELVEENCRLTKLREEIIDGDVPAMPEAPATAEEGKEEEATKAYAEYILTLVGDQWDSKKGAWADESSSYATALADYNFDGKTASYNAAQAAYYVAYQEYTTKSQEIATQWTDFLNGLLSNASIEINSMVS